NSAAINLTGGNGGLTVNQTGTTPSFSNLAGGTLSIAAGLTLQINGGTCNHDPGTHTGPGQLVVVGATVVGVTLSPTSAELVLRTGSTVDVLTNGGTVIAQGNPNTVTGSLTSLPGSTIRVAAAVTFAN